MTGLDYFNAALLGAIQGLAEFLPISSSGHLALTQRMMGLDPAGGEMLLFDVLAHLGTLIAVLIVFWRSATRFARRLTRELGGHVTGRRNACRVALLGIVATIPTGAIGLGFKDKFEAAFDNPTTIGVCLLITGVLLAVLVKAQRGRRGWKDYRWWEAALVGIAQGMAILPGISRSGATICMASYCGWRRRWAAEFSFLIAVPAIAGGTLLKITDTLDLPSEVLQSVAWGPILFGSAISLVIGIFALKILLDAVRRAKLHYFAAYCWLVGLMVLTMA